MKTRFALWAAIAVGLAACAASVGNSPKLLRSAIDDKQDDLDKCYAKNLKSDAKGAGAMQVTLHVAADGGKVASVKVTSTDIDDKKLDKCVKATLEAVTIDPAPSADFDIDYTLDFGAQPDKDAGDKDKAGKAKGGDDDSGDDDKPASKPKSKPAKPDKGDDSDDDG